MRSLRVPDMTAASNKRPLCQLRVLQHLVVYIHIHGPLSTRAFYPVIKFFVSFSLFPPLSNAFSCTPREFCFRFLRLYAAGTGSHHIIWWSGRVYKRAHHWGAIKYISLPRNTHSINPRTTQLLLNKLKTHPHMWSWWCILYVRTTLE